MSTAEGGPAAGPLAPDAAGTWHRVHPVSPLVRGWLALAAIAYFFGRDWFETLFRGDQPWAASGGRIGWTAAAAAAVLLLLVGGYLLSWWFTRFQVTKDHVRVTSGVLFRQHRQARLDRVQAIDIVQPLLARIFALAELKFEVADAGESAVRLAYLPLADAQRLRAAILAHAAGVELDPAHPEEAPEAPEHPVLEVPGGRVAGAAFLSGTTVFLLLVAGAAAALTAALDAPAAAAVLLPALFGVGAGYWSFFSTAYNFRAAISPDGIRLRYGLLETRAQTVPPGRVQAVSVSQPPLWRLKGWYRMRVNVAGYGVAGENAAARTTLLPVGTRADVMQMLALVLPDPGTEDPLAVFAAGLDGTGSAGGFQTSPPRMRWLSPLAWRRNGYAATATALLMRSGALWRELVVVPHERTQSMALHQGPLARRLGVADLRLHTTVGPVDPRVLQIDAAAARRLFDEQAARAAAARRAGRPERWLEAPPQAGPPDQALRAEEQPGERAGGGTAPRGAGRMEGGNSAGPEDGGTQDHGRG
ncbi:PH domain-containing protein [Arthrobacter mobilis]|uniref:PH domain-containing protein n=1 Tax=Arthrobacter mobilis TaxID=2724944 RepID=A0A7X6HFH8_9MICC|nr:PH domain-containing protein [Arthrobacter mobilis]NKX55086.1 PH domain-containing protein [Arthrobacter mobilis]